MLHWMAIFGAPVRFLSDNGGEFKNYDFQDMSENLNVEIATTDAESPWSNGVVEHHNAVIGNMVDDKPPALEGITSSEVVAKSLNALHAVYVKHLLKMKHQKS